MKQDWAQKAVEKFTVKNGLGHRIVYPCDAVLVVRMALRQRDAMWKRAVKRLMDNPKGITLMGRAHYYEALDDLIAAMKEGRK